MTSPQKRIVRRFYEEMWNCGDKSLIPDLFVEGFAFRGSLGPKLTGHAEFAGYVDQVLSGLSDYVCDIIEMTEEDDRVCVRLLFHGTHSGTFMGYAATGRRVKWAGSAHFAFDGEKIRDLWVLGDVYGLMEQLEATAGTGA